MTLVDTSRLEPHKPDTLNHATPPAQHKEMHGVPLGHTVVEPESEIPPSREPDSQTSPERSFEGDGKSWVTVSGARLRLLEGGGHNHQEASQPPQSPATASHQEAVGPADTCSCGSVFLPDAAFCRKCGSARLVAKCSNCGTSFEADAGFCRKCGAKRHVAGSNASNTAPSSSSASASAVESPQRRHGAALPMYAVAKSQASANHLLTAPVTPNGGNFGGKYGLPSYQEKMKLQYQDLAQEVLAEQASEAQLEARLNSELNELKNRSTEEANAINEICKQIGDASFLKDEICHMDEARQLLQAELLAEENHRQVWEAEANAEEQELRARLEARQQHLSEMAASRRSMKMHLQSMASVKAWLRDDIEDVRRTWQSVEATGQRELQQRGEEIERVSNELHVLIQEHRSDHDTWRAQAESEVFRLRQESKRQIVEEKQLCESLELARAEDAKVSSKLREDVEASALKNTELEQQIRQTLQECKEQDEVQRPRSLEEESRLEAEHQAADKEQAELLEELLADEALCTQAEQRTGEQRRWEMSEASSATMSTRERQDARLRDKELNALRHDLRETELYHAQLCDDLERAKNRGIFNCVRRRAKPASLPS